MVDPLLPSSSPTLPNLVTSVDNDLSVSTSGGPSTVVVEGMPPLSTKLLEKIRRWEYVDLALLLEDQGNRPLEEYKVAASGQILVLEQDRGQRRRKQTLDIFS